MQIKSSALYVLSVGFVIIVAVLALVRYKLNSSSDTNYDYDMESFIVTLIYIKDKIRIGIPCIGVYIGNNSIISTVSCIKPYQDFNLYAIIGFQADNNTEPILLTSHRNHRDYVKHNRFDADIKHFTFTDNITNNSIQLETNSDLKRTLKFYTTDPYKLYRISVNINYKPKKVIISRDQIGDCGQLIYCLKLENSESIGSVLVAQLNDSYLLLGIQQSQTNVNGNVPYTRFPLYAAWISIP